MSPELLAISSFAIAAVATYLATPIAIGIALRMSFFDVPRDYKEHTQPTPYLGGTAIMIGILVAFLSVRGGVQEHALIIGVAVLILMIGTLDDRINLPISVRTLLEVGIAALLWATGRGWNVFHDAPADLVLTVLWVVGIMNAFNLMDNMDGAAATVAAVSAIGAGVLALVSGDMALAPLAFAVGGACFGFLPRNLSRPARIFMGDGGSLLLGLLVARLSMAAVTRSYLGPSGVVVAALLVGLVILDTTLVSFSRARGGRPVFSGGRDHLTHRLSRALGSPRNVALTLAITQLVICGVTIAVARAGVGWVLLAGAVAILFGVALIWQLEISPRFVPRASAPAAPKAAIATPEVLAGGGGPAAVPRLRVVHTGSAPQRAPAMPES